MILASKLPFEAMLVAKVSVRAWASSDLHSLGSLQAVPALMMFQPSQQCCHWCVEHAKHQSPVHCCKNSRIRHSYSAVRCLQLRQHVYKVDTTTLACMISFHNCDSAMKVAAVA